MKISLAALALLALTSTSAFAHDYKVGDLIIDHPWTRATPPNAQAGGGFLTVENGGATDDTLVSIESDAADKVEVHEMAVVDGVMKMRQLEAGVPIPAGQTIDLKPGGLHIMFIGLKQPFKEGEVVKAKLNFEKAGSVDVDLHISAMGTKAMPAGDGHDHGGDAHNANGHGHDHGSSTSSN